MLNVVEGTVRCVKKDIETLLHKGDFLVVKCDRTPILVASAAPPDGEVDKAVSAQIVWTLHKAKETTTRIQELQHRSEIGRSSSGQVGNQPVECGYQEFEWIRPG
jgi:hypothetical protein